jgi:drug/metabolite transporter (DMT)-like permease
MTAITTLPAAHSASAGQADNISRGIAFILVSGGLFSIFNAGVKLLSVRFGPVEIGFFRQLFSLIPIGVAMMRHGGAALITKRPFGHLFRGLIGNSSAILVFLSLAWLPLADATALSFAAPLFTTVLSVPLLRERVGWYRWSAVAVGFAGVIVMTNPGGDWLARGEGAGAIVALSAAFLSAVMMITLRQLGRTERPVTTVFYFATLGCVLFGALLPFFWIRPTLAEAAGLAGVGIVGGLAQLTMTNAYRHAPASALAPFGYVAIVWSALLGYLLWRQLPGPRVLAGAMIVIASGLFIIYREARRRSRASSQPLPAPG